MEILGTDAEHRMLTQEDILARGWTRGAVKRFLGRPDRKGRKQPGRSAATLYCIQRVEEVERDEGFLGYLRRFQRRRENALKRRAAERAQEEANDSAGIEVEISIVPWDGLRREATRHGNARRHGSAVHESGAAHLHRVVLNHVRHELTNYDRLVGHARTARGRFEIQQHVAARIAEHYPRLRGAVDAFVEEKRLELLEVARVEQEEFEARRGVLEAAARLIARHPD